jgi:hypothetical protein
VRSPSVENDSSSAEMTVSTRPIGLAESRKRTGYRTRFLRLHDFCAQRENFCQECRSSCPQSPPPPPESESSPMAMNHKPSPPKNQLRCHVPVSVPSDSQVENLSKAHPCACPAFLAPLKALTTRIHSQRWRIVGRLPMRLCGTQFTRPWWRKACGSIADPLQRRRSVGATFRQHRGRYRQVARLLSQRNPPSRSS